MNGITQVNELQERGSLNCHINSKHLELNKLKNLTSTSPQVETVFSLSFQLMSQTILQAYHLVLNYCKLDLYRLTLVYGHLSALAQLTFRSFLNHATVPSLHYKLI